MEVLRSHRVRTTAEPVRDTRLVRSYEAYDASFFSASSIRMKKIPVSSSKLFHRNIKLGVELVRFLLPDETIEGREIVEAHFKASLEAGVTIAGLNAEVRTDSSHSTDGGSTEPVIMKSVYQYRQDP